MVFPVDTRLRPHGREGELLVSPAQLMAYSAQEAHPWEALMYTKLRYVAGSYSLAQRALFATNVLFQRFAGDPAFVDPVREMRAKLEAADSEKSLKTSAGAVYDIDFISSFLLVKNRVSDKQGSLRDRLWRCAAAGLLANPDAALLDHAAELLRTVDHVLRLVVGRASKWLPANQTARRLVESITSRILRRDFPAGLEPVLDETRGHVREVFTRLLSE
jgi:glutamate-ammonia-ligase adenylyltransferase